jgi:hypothetical protein
MDTAYINEFILWQNTICPDGYSGDDTADLTSLDHLTPLP